LNIVLELGNSEAVSMAVEEGMGAAFVSRMVARRGIELGKIKEVRVDGLSFQREIYIAHSHRHPATQSQTEFWNFIQEPENEQLLKLAA
jgi:DNA-binding transcriptional LysR family regulator